MNTSLEDFLKEIDASSKSFLDGLEELVEPAVCDSANYYWVGEDHPRNGNEGLYH